MSVHDIDWDSEYKEFEERVSDDSYEDMLKDYISDCWDNDTEYPKADYSISETAEFEAEWTEEFNKTIWQEHVKILWELEKDEIVEEYLKN